MTFTAAIECVLTVTYEVTGGICSLSRVSIGKQPIRLRELDYDARCALDYEVLDDYERFIRSAQETKWDHERHESQ